MMFNVIVVTLLVTFIMDESTSIVVPTSVWFIQMPTIETKSGMFYILTFL